jgi:hypothetical protein
MFILNVMLEKLKTQLIIKNFLKNHLKDEKFVKEITAGIMGNIMTECGFNPLALNKKDDNGYQSYGIIQWNTKFYKDVKTKVGTTAASQIPKVVDGYTGYWKRYLKKVNEYKTIDAWTSAYEFANIVEVCTNCNKGLDKYKNSEHPVSRSHYANDFYKRFADTSDKLSW